MLLYEDIITGDEMFSDAFPLYVSVRYLRSESVLNCEIARKLMALRTRSTAR